jgi:hypothetical protein
VRGFPAALAHAIAPLCLCPVSGASAPACTCVCAVTGLYLRLSVSCQRLSKVWHAHTRAVAGWLVSRRRHWLDSWRRAALLACFLLLAFMPRGAMLL